MYDVIHLPNVKKDKQVPRDDACHSSSPNYQSKRLEGLEGNGSSIIGLPLQGKAKKVLLLWC